MRELGNTSNKDKTQPRVQVFNRTIEVLHDQTEFYQIFLLMHDIQQWSIILINENDYLLPRLLISTFYQTFQTLISLNSPIFRTIDLFQLA
ncbi:Uncharacterised protein [Segatella copri]|nr:Uncharacterised protein [Segatella copri]